MSIVDKYTLKPSLIEKFDGIIWKIETDDKEPIVAIETRNIADRKTYYSAFNYQNGECLFKEITVENSWLWSIHRVHNNMVLLHSYKNDNSPEHAGIIAVNNKGEILWSHFNQTLEDVTDLGLLVYNPKIQPRSLQIIATDTGELLAGNISSAIPLYQNVVLPDINVDASVFNSVLPVDVIMPFFYKHHKGKDIFVYHTRSQNLYTQQLIVSQLENIIFKDSLATDIQKMNPEAFFIQRNHLFYIRNNKQEFVSYLV